MGWILSARWILAFPEMFSLSLEIGVRAATRAAGLHMGRTRHMRNDWRTVRCMRLCQESA
jgi:hypothetical protein